MPTTRIFVSAEDFDHMQATLANPPPPTPALIAAARRYQEDLDAGRIVSEVTDEADYARVLSNLRRIIPGLPAQFRILQACDGAWRSPRTEWWVTVRELTEHMLCFGYAGYQLEVPTENGARKVDVYRDELLRVRMPMAGPAAELQAAIAENRAYAGR